MFVKFPVMVTRAEKTGIAGAEIRQARFASEVYIAVMHIATLMIVGERETLITLVGGQSVLVALDGDAVIGALNQKIRAAQQRDLYGPGAEDEDEEP